MDLRNDKDWRVAKLVTKNPGITDEALEKLTTDSNYRIKYKAYAALIKRTAK
jgi:hypothetical protein